MGVALPRRIIVVGIVASAIGLSVALSRVQSPPPAHQPDAAPPLVEVLELQAETLRLPVHSQGSVEPVTQTALSAEVSGAIVKVSPRFVAGGLFETGEVLLQIDPSDYAAAVKQAEALLQQRQIEYDGAAQLRQKGYRAAVDQASTAAALASAEADLARARRNLERTRIRLPYAGMVRSKSADLGQFVTPGTPLGVVFATAQAEVRLPLSDADLAFLDLPAPGKEDIEQAPQVRLQARLQGEQRVWPARIVRQEGVIDERNRMHYLVARIEDPYALDGSRPALPVGTFVAATIQGRAMPNLVRVPAAALSQGTRLLLVDERDRLLIQHSQPLHSDDEYAYLSAEALPSTRLVLTALASPVEGLALRLRGVANSTDAVRGAGAGP
ncbi:MAG: efflux RND transporter periplasmic adaptor subunit [Xanthomonadales bacterium]|nr:efflux RND transporter periplasmic adaptor subunit [Xanthomonadales bacterium]